jgi:predicted outer membrane repeat protein
LLRRRALCSFIVANISQYLVLILLMSVLCLAGCAAVFTPQATFSYSPGSCYCHQQMTFDASACSSRNEDIATYSWRFGDGGFANGKVVQHAFASPGNYSVSLTITTENGKQASVTRAVHVASALVVPTAYKTIQTAINAASDGEMVIVMPGTYRENVMLRGNNITVQSSDPDDTSVVNSTIIRGKEYDTPTIIVAEGSRSTLAGFKILAGPAPPGSDYCSACAGIVYIREASPTIRNNHISDHIRGIQLIESDALIIENTIQDNACAEPGAGIYINSYAVAPEIVGNTFINNSAPYGAAIYVNAYVSGNKPAVSAATTIRKNVFRDNTATGSGRAPATGAAVHVEFYSRIRLDNPDSNTYLGNDPDNIFYTMPPSG